jgi:fermentation-respiration switch protein FrsA (DUF1100 family)
LLLKDKFRSDLIIEIVAQPKLFIHGRRDDVVPLRFGEALFELAREPKAMRVHDAYGHNDLWNEPGAVREIVAFVEKVARP